MRLPGFPLDAYIYWDDEDDDNENWDSYTRYRRPGSLPDGSYGRNTKIYYCCRNDGSPTHSIYLPIDTPFVLIRFDYSPCQHVYGTKSTEEFFRWDCENNSPQSKAERRYPFVEVDGGKNVKVHYCYYKRA